MAIEPICIILGSGRSGTTLLAEQLRQHPLVESFFELPSLSIWLRCLRDEVWPPKEADFAQDLDNIELATELDDGFNWRINKREAISIHEEFKAAVTLGKDARTAISQWLGQYHLIQLKRSGKKFLVHKTPGLSRFIPQLLELLPDVQLVHALRHPCAVVASYLTVDWGTKDLDEAINWYVERVGPAQQFGRVLGKQMIEVRFEMLLATPGLALEAIRLRLDIPDCGHIWTVDVRLDRLEAWRVVLTRDQAAYILASVRCALPQLGY
jgi:hypothetical protein